MLFHRLRPIRPSRDRDRPPPKEGFELSRWAPAVITALLVVIASACSSTFSPDSDGDRPVIARSPLPRHPPNGPSLRGIHKIKHVIIVMQENRSFDSYFGTFPGAEGISEAAGTPAECQPIPDIGPCLSPFHDPNLQNAGGPHAMTDAIDDINRGRMDGFAIRALEGSAGCLVLNETPYPPCTEVPDRPDAMGYHDDREIPNYWTYARNFTLHDHMFSPTLGPSLPAHLYMVSGWSASCSDRSDPMSCVSNNGLAAGLHPYIRGEDFQYAWTDLTYLLHRNGVSWAYYIAPHSLPDCDEHIPMCERPSLEPGTPGLWNPLPEFTTVIQDQQLGNIKHHDRFFAAARKGTLPAVSWIVPNKVNSEHPPASIADGQAWVTRVVNAVMRSPNWKSSAIFVSWDDWGGFYDHVAPPKVDSAGYGIRVPSFLISPYAKRHYIDHQVLSFDAYLKFIEDDFLNGARIDPRTDGRPDSRPNVREDAPQLGNLIKDFDFSKRRPRLILPLRP
jgi:phospholipase C